MKHRSGHRLQADCVGAGVQVVVGSMYDVVQKARDGDGKDAVPVLCLLSYHSVQEEEYDAIISVHAVSAIVQVGEGPVCESQVQIVRGVAEVNTSVVGVTW